MTGGCPAGRFAVDEGVGADADADGAAGARAGAGAGKGAGAAAADDVAAIGAHDDAIAAVNSEAIATVGGNCAVMGAGAGARAIGGANAKEAGPRVDAPGRADIIWGDGIFRGEGERRVLGREIFGEADFGDEYASGEDGVSGIG